MGAETFAPPACMVARATGGALAPTWPGAVESPGGVASSRFKARSVNVEGSRMREIRTYGLMRGCWPVRLARRAGVYSTRLRRLRRLISGRAAALRAGRCRNNQKPRELLASCALLVLIISDTDPAGRSPAPRVLRQHTRARPIALRMAIRISKLCVDVEGWPSRNSAAVRVSIPTPSSN